METVFRQAALLGLASVDFGQLGLVDGHRGVRTEQRERVEEESRGREGAARGAVRDGSSLYTLAFLGELWQAIYQSSRVDSQEQQQQDAFRYMRARRINRAVSLWTLYVQYDMQ